MRSSHQVRGMAAASEVAVEQVRRLFGDAPFIADLGIALLDVGAGWCEAGLGIAERHRQQDGLIHAGVQTTLADHTAGAAAATLVGESELVLTSNFDMHLLRAGRGETLRCRAEVLKRGRLLTVVDSRVYASGPASEKLIARATVTLAVLAASGSQG